MVHRITKLSKSHSFFLFGARGTGKSSLLHEMFDGKNTLYIDLLSSEWEDRLLINPDSLKAAIKEHKTKPDWVIIDEVQKVPKLLDVVHQLIESQKIKFALTGSSARKLKRGSANLLAGRAFLFELFPLTHVELKNNFDLHQYLMWGGLPALLSMPEEIDRIRYLRTYATTYLKEEIQAEQLVRKLKPFRLFLDVAAQMNAKIINYSKIAQDIGVDVKTVQSYFEILRDTHIGILLPAFHESIRKRQKANPKFYYFDTGVTRSLRHRTGVPLTQSTFEYGDLFEQFIVLECHRLNSYYEKDFTFSYIQTHNNLEIDLVIERPGLPRAFVEIKSASQFEVNELRAIHGIKKDHPKSDCYCLTNGEEELISNGIAILPWRKGLKELGFF